MVEVRDSLEDALKDFKKKVNRDGIHVAIKRRLAHVKPSEKRKAKAAIANRRRRDLQRKMELKERERYGQHKRLRGSSLSEWQLRYR